ncbi:MAG: TauD/TfdA family dioxygenase [Novosphingobium sp.]|nr:TauD/TfdA family dioxygenase [Novosphingobium sp.]
MSFQIEPTSAPLGAFVTGLDLTTISETEVGELYQAFLDHGVLIFRGQTFDASQMLALSDLFGETGLHPIETLRHTQVPKLIVLAANNGEPVADDDPTADTRIGTIPWHTDLIYTEASNHGALLRAVTIPKEEGQTGWIDTCRVYRKLPSEIKTRIQGLQIVHSYALTHSKQSMVGGSPNLFPDVVHPLVYVHPENDLPVLNISPSSAKEIIGLPADEAEELLEYLIDFACREDEAYVHEWQPDDVVLWDNWRTIHRAYGHLKRYPRLMHRTTLCSELKMGQWVEQ